MSNQRNKPIHMGTTESGMLYDRTVDHVNTQAILIDKDTVFISRVNKKNTCSSQMTMRIKDLFNIVAALNMVTDY